MITIIELIIIPIAGLNGVHLLGHGGQVTVPMERQEPVANTHVVVGAKKSCKAQGQLQVPLGRGLGCQCTLPGLLFLTMGTWKWRSVSGVKLGACRYTAGEPNSRLAQWCRLVIGDKVELDPHAATGALTLIAAQSPHRHAHSSGGW